MSGQSDWTRDLTPPVRTNGAAFLFHADTSEYDVNTNPETLATRILRDMLPAIKDVLSSTRFTGAVEDVILSLNDRCFVHFNLRVPPEYDCNLYGPALMNAPDLGKWIEKFRDNWHDVYDYGPESLETFLRLTTRIARVAYLNNIERQGVRIIPRNNPNRDAYPLPFDPQRHDRGSSLNRRIGLKNELDEAERRKRVSDARKALEKSTRDAEIQQAVEANVAALKRELDEKTTAYELELTALRRERDQHKSRADTAESQLKLSHDTLRNVAMQVSAVISPAGASRPYRKPLQRSQEAVASDDESGGNRPAKRRTGKARPPESNGEAQGTQSVRSKRVQAVLGNATRRFRITSDAVGTRLSLILTAIGSLRNIYGDGEGWTPEEENQAEAALCEMKSMAASLHGDDPTAERQLMKSIDDIYQITLGRIEDSRRRRAQPAPASASVPADDQSSDSDLAAPWGGS